MTMDLADGATVVDVLNHLSMKFNNPAFINQKTLLMINNENALPQSPLKEGDTVHLLPILGGG